MIICMLISFSSFAQSESNEIQHSTLKDRRDPRGPRRHQGPRPSGPREGYYADQMIASEHRSLHPGQTLVSKNGIYTLMMQNDCNLVIYRGTPSIQNAVWDTSTHGRGFNCRATMQSDGNFVVYDAFNRALFDTGTHGNANTILLMQDDGNLVIYAPHGPIWDSW